MPWIKTGSSCDLFIDDVTHTDPWGPSPEVVVLIHGMAESGRVWRSWLPHLTHTFRVITLDLPGFGRSRVDVDEYVWSIQSFSREVTQVLDALDVASAHIVGAKLGGSVALATASIAPSRTSSVVSLTGPMWASGPDTVTHQTAIAARVRQIGILGWATETMDARLGTSVSRDQRRWWIESMARTDREVLARTSNMGTKLDLRPTLANIDFPALMITSLGSPLAASETRDQWHHLVAGARSVVFPNDGYHIAAIEPELCAKLVWAFISGDADAFSRICSEHGKLDVRPPHQEVQTGPHSDTLDGKARTRSGDA